MPEPTAPPTLLNRFHAAPIQERGKGHILNGATRVLTKTTSAKKSVNTAAKGAATSATKSVSTAAKGSATSAASGAISSLSGIEDDVAEKLSKKLGVKGFYSIHLINLCYGDFEPNATNPSATLNATNCTTPFDYGSLNFSALLDHQLSVGSHSLNLADLGLTKDIQDKINDIPKIIRAIVATYIIAAGFICFGLIASVAAIILIPHPSGQMIVKGNIGLASLAVIFLLIGNLITTIGSSKVVEEVTKHGNHLGLYAERGVKYMAVTWATFGIMLLTVFYWVYEFFAEKRRGSEEINRAIANSREAGSAAAVSSFTLRTLLQPIVRQYAQVMTRGPENWWEEWRRCSEMWILVTPDACINWSLDGLE
ncbi:hypothetical protein SLS53_006840 [Cytospora paraplurivora]|uniref:Actin cortical patch SUR7/pH-response regulator PalI n=1 Tax=Cytospora paraplurivora TaxID=2898453 RepID=A0AAN9U1B9_9PEZI